MVGWHHWLDGHEFEEALGVGNGQGSLAYCSPWGRKESDTTEQLNWTGKDMHLGDLPGSPWQLRLPDWLHRLWVWSLVLVVVQVFSPIQLLVTPWTAAHQASWSFTVSWSLLKLMSIELMMPSNHLILCCPLPLPSNFPSIRVFSSELALCIRWPKYWSFSFSISPSNEHPGLISFRMDWLDLLAVQGTLRSLLQHHNSKASFLRHSAFFMVQLSLLYMTTGKTIALIIRTFVSKLMFLLFNMLSRFFSYSSKEQASLNFMAAVCSGGTKILHARGTAQNIE